MLLILEIAAGVVLGLVIFKFPIHMLALVAWFLQLGLAVAIIAVILFMASLSH
jgi:hypothetical protein